jgi:hypothetical protein
MTVLNVPYAEKDQARALGAKWNPTRKTWYVPPGVALEPFAAWLPKEGAAPKAPKARVDSYAGKPVTGANYIELDHDCNPFEECPVCRPKLEASGWWAARVAITRVL